MAICAGGHGAGVVASNYTFGLEGREHFAPSDAACGYLEPSSHRSTRIGNGRAGSFDVVADGQHRRKVHYFYPAASVAALKIVGHIVLLKGGEVLRPSGPESAGGWWGLPRRLVSSFLSRWPESRT
jgi:uncharacterized protein (DUF427 family)